MKFLIQEKFDPLFERACINNKIEIVREGLADFKFGGCEFIRKNYLPNTDNFIGSGSFYSVDGYCDLDESLNKFKLVQIKDLINKKWDIFLNFAIDAKIFIRPYYGDKAFNGCVVDIIEFDKFVEDISKECYTHHFACISSPKKILAEWRLVCSGNEIITSSLYAFQGLFSPVKGCPPLVSQFCKKILAKLHNAPKMFVVDICMLESKEMKLIEFNSIESSGLYACDRELVVKKIIDILK